jgi:hypothetical protein
MKASNRRVPPPWSDEMEQALMEHSKAIRAGEESSRRSRWPRVAATLAAVVVLGTLLLSVADGS